MRKERLHIFLTGEIQIGKTTIVEQVIKMLQVPIGGFRTYFGVDRFYEEKELYMNAAWLPKEYNKNLSIATFKKGMPPIVHTDIFNQYGGDWIHESREFAKLMIMDECGRFESKAERFKEEIIKSLYDDIPILGVIKEVNDCDWLDLIRNHSKVNVITVNQENRNELPLILYGHFKHKRHLKSTS